MKSHRHGDLGQLLANTVAHDGPQVEAVVGFLGDARASASRGDVRLLAAVGGATE